MIAPPPPASPVDRSRHLRPAYAYGLLRTYVIVYTHTGVWVCSAFFCFALSRRSWFLDLTLPFAFAPFVPFTPFATTSASAAMSTTSALEEVEDESKGRVLT